MELVGETKDTTKNWQDSVDYCKSNNKFLFQVRNDADKDLIFKFFAKIPKRFETWGEEVGIGWKYDRVVNGKRECWVCTTTPKDLKKDCKKVKAALVCRSKPGNQ